MPIHYHRSKSESETGWNGCVTPHQCATTPARCAAHGGIIRTEVCQCGAECKIEINGRDRNVGAWVVPTTREDRVAIRILRYADCDNDMGIVGDELLSNARTYLADRARYWRVHHAQKMQKIYGIGSPEAKLAAAAI